jgi:hypothetical protein
VPVAYSLFAKGTVAPGAVARQLEAEASATRAGKTGLSPAE